MKRKMILFLVLVLLFLVLLTNCLQGEEKEQGAFRFNTGNDYLNMAEGNNIFYVEGLMDMLYNQTELYNPKLYSSIVKTTKVMTAGQIKAIFDKYLEEHPESWHYNAAYLFGEAIFEIIIGE